MSQEIDTESLVDGRGFVFEVEIYTFFTSTAFTAVSDTIILNLFFHSETGKCLEKTAKNC